MPLRRVPPGTPSPDSAEAGYEGNRNLVIIAACSAVGLIPIAVPEFWSEFPTWLGTIRHSGISATALVAVPLKVVFNEIRGRQAAWPSVIGVAPDQRGSLPQSGAH
jgi:xanthine/uracil permease